MVYKIEYIKLKMNCKCFKFSDMIDETEAILDDTSEDFELEKDRELEYIEVAMESIWVTIPIRPIMQQTTDKPESVEFEHIEAKIAETEEKVENGK